MFYLITFVFVFMYLCEIKGHYTEIFLNQGIDLPLYSSQSDLSEGVISPYQCTSCLLFVLFCYCANKTTKIYLYYPF